MNKSRLASEEAQRTSEIAELKLVEKDPKPLVNKLRAKLSEIQARYDDLDAADVNFELELNLDEQYSL